MISRRVLPHVIQKLWAFSLVEMAPCPMTKEVLLVLGEFDWHFLKPTKKYGQNKTCPTEAYTSHEMNQGQDSSLTIHGILVGLIPRNEVCPDCEPRTWDTASKSSPRRSRATIFPARHSPLSKSSKQRVSVN